MPSVKNESIESTGNSIVAAQFQLSMFDNHEVILDLRSGTDSFISNVNDIQIGVIRNRHRQGKLHYFCNLPAAAKEFVRARLKVSLQELKEQGNSEALQRLDVACWRHEILSGETSLTSSVRKRWVSGFFAILPIDAIPIAIERCEFTPSHMNSEYWKSIQIKAERLGAPDTHENFASRE